MPTLPALTLALLSTNAVAAQDVPVMPATVEFQVTLAAARAKSAEVGKPVALYFTFETCHWCGEMERRTFPQPEVVSAMDRFVWAKIDRDAMPETAQRFNVIAYPSFLILGRRDENVHRFSDFHEPLPFIAQIDDALERMERYEAGLDWTLPKPRPGKLIDSDKVELRSFPAPSNELPGGLAFVGDALYVVQQQHLSRRDPETGEYRRHTIPPSIVDVCSDGQLLYAVSYGWTAGRPILILDPSDGTVLHEILTDENVGNKAWAGHGIAYKDGRLFVLTEGSTINVVELETGVVIARFHTGLKDLLGLDWDGESFVAGSRKGFYFLDGTSLRPYRHVPTEYPLRSVAFKDGEVYAMEQPVFGFDKNHKRIQIWPRKGLVHVVRLPDPEKARAEKLQAEKAKREGVGGR